MLSVLSIKGVVIILKVRDIETLNSHKVEYDDWEIETYKPETGMRIVLDN